MSLWFIFQCRDDGHDVVATEVGAEGYGFASDVRDRPLIRPSICPNLVSGADLGNPWRDLFNCAHTHPSLGVDGPFMVY